MSKPVFWGVKYLILSLLLRSNKKFEKLCQKSFSLFVNFSVHMTWDRYFDFFKKWRPIVHGFFKFIMFVCPVIKHNYEKFIIIGQILMFYWFAFPMHKQSNFCSNDQGVQMDFYMMQFFFYNLASTKLYYCFS